MKQINFAFFGSSRFSEFVLEELIEGGYSPILKVTNAKAPLPELPRDLDVAIVASFGKILPKEYLSIPKLGFLNVHPSLLPELRGPSPIQNLILQDKTPGVTIIKMDEQMDHGPILAQEKVSITPFPDHYSIVEEKLARAGGKLLAEVLPTWVSGEAKEEAQDDTKATYIKMIKKEDGLIDLNDAADKNLRKVLAYSTWPGAYFFFTTKMGKEVRLVVKDAKIEEGKFTPTMVIPAGKREMNWQDFLRGNS
jgi:methionyl-tRNA formyltransferase